MGESAPAVEVQEHCSCGASFVIGGSVTARVALNATRQWRSAHRCAPPLPGPPVVHERGSAMTEQAAEMGSPTLGFCGAT